MLYSVWQKKSNKTSTFSNINFFIKDLCYYTFYILFSSSLNCVKNGVLFVVCKISINLNRRSASFQTSHFGFPLVNFFRKIVSKPSFSKIWFERRVLNEKFRFEIFYFKKTVRNEKKKRFKINFSFRIFEKYNYFRNAFFRNKPNEVHRSLYSFASLPFLTKNIRLKTFCFLYKPPKHSSLINNKTFLMLVPD